MAENFLATRSRFDETEAAIVTPLDDGAFEAHA
jgi:hypothetical protein